MSLRDSDEILPLLDRNRRRDEGNTEYQSLFRSSLKRSCVRPKNREKSLLKNVTKQNASGGCSYTSQLYTNPIVSEDSLEQKITYSWNNLNVFRNSESGSGFSVWRRSCSANGKKSGQSKQILENAYGVAYPGELLAIMGGSGAGKTTLLNALTFHSGDKTTVKGIRCLNGIPISDRITIAGHSAYVEQENLFIGTLTVKEHLIFQSMLRIDRNVPYREKLKRVEEVIEEVSFPNDLSKGLPKEPEETIQYCFLEQLGLERCQHTVIGYEGRSKGISGGERKRLSFGSEILTNPPIMFCDEPTSGLDSFMALNVINVLKSMAIRGKTVICTIHQPSSEIFSLFDKILLVAEGRTAFLGKPGEAISFFSGLGASPPANYNPADFFIQLLAVVPNREDVCKGNVKLICDYFDQSPQGMEIVNKIETQTQLRFETVLSHTTAAVVVLSNDLKLYSEGYHLQNSGESSSTWRRCNATLGISEEFAYNATWICQFRALFWRSWINIIKEPILVKVRLFQTVILSLVVGLIYHGQKLNEDGVMNINGVLFTFLTNMTFQNLFAVISVFCNELPVFLKEHSSQLYRVDAYFLSKTLAEIPMFLAIPVIFTSITYYWINLNPELYHFGFAVLILILVTNVATSFGYFISCISTNIVMALSIGPPVIIPFLLFGGFLLNTGVVPAYLKWLSYLSWFKYGNEALLINQWSDIKNIDCNATSVTCPRNGEIVLEIYHFEKENFWWDISSLLVLNLLFRTLAFLALLLKAKRYHR